MQGITEIGTGSLIDAIKNLKKKGEKYVLLYKGKWNELDPPYIPHPNGIIIAKSYNQIFLNGGLLYKGRWDYLREHPKGVVIKNGLKHLLNGTELLYEGECDGVEYHSEGIIIHRGSEFLLNDTELLCTYTSSKAFEWTYCPKGIVIVIEEKFLLNGTELIYEGPWREFHSHPEGVAIRVEDKFLLNGTKFLYDYTSSIYWDDKREKIATEEDDNFFINGEFILNAEHDEWILHSEGIVIQIDDELRLYPF